MFLKYSVKKVIFTALVAMSLAAGVAYASHSWGGYHWARTTTDPFTLKLGDNVSATWDAYLAEASADWSQSAVLDTTVVGGGTKASRCRPTSGRVEVCSYRYGFNGWLGLATIWVSGGHITRGTVKTNDSYFGTATYNTPPWRRLVMCQEVAHTLGLDHQDVDSLNPNLGTCMDYTDDPDGPPSNEHPNAHDYEQLVSIYGHSDGFTTIGQAVARHGSRNDEADAQDLEDEAQRRGRNRSHYERDLGGGEKLYTFVLRAE